MLQVQQGSYRSTGHLHDNQSRKMTEVLPKISEFVHRLGNWGELRTTITTMRANVY